MHLRVFIYEYRNAMGSIGQTLFRVWQLLLKQIDHKTKAYFKCKCQTI